MTTVLIVDDSPSDRDLLGTYIQKETDYAIEYAEHGVDALEKMKGALPDVILTDLRMPEMDGMGLVKAVKEQHPQVPVILVTSVGSESLAVNALRSGAAGYVPKEHLREMMVETIAQVIDVVQSDRNYERLIGSLIHNQYRFYLENDPALFPPLVTLLQQMTYGMNICEAAGRRRIGVALDEALLNALYHGNLELPPEQLQQVRGQLRQGQVSDLIKQQSQQEDYKDRRIFVEATLTPEEVRFTIRDDGMGFHPGAIPEAGDPKTLEKEGGRGLILIKNFMDEVMFNDMGNRITLVKRREE